MRFSLFKYCLIILPAVCLVVSSCSFNRAFFDKKYLVKSLPDTIDVEFLKVKNKNGKNLSAAFFKPKNTPTGTVFMLKGNTGDLSQWYDIISIIIKHNYQVLAFDYEGIGESQGKANHRNVLSDSQLMLNYLIKRNDVRGRKLILWGFSFGGNLAVKLARDNPGVFNLLVLEGSFTSQRDIAIRRMPWILKPYVWTFAKSPYASKKLISQLKNLPVLIIHSVEDKEIPYRMGEELYRKAKEPKLFFEVLGNHCDGLKNYDTEYFEKIDSMLK